MIVTLERFSYSDTETEGLLTVGDLKLVTIEQPWVPNPNGAGGGLPFNSCVPEGMYELRPWIRPSGAEAYILFSPQLGVYLLPEDHPEGKGRDLCLFHSGNWVDDVVGCIAPGLFRAFMSAPGSVVAPAVSSSRTAMKKFLKALGRKRHLLNVKQVAGAVDIKH